MRDSDAPGESAGRPNLVGSCAGGSLLEVALIMPFFILLMCYAVDYGYFCIAAASITSAAHNACEYSGAGFTAPGQATPPSAATVEAEVESELTNYLNASTKTTIQVCSVANGVASNTAECTSSGPAGTTYTPGTDPEAPHFVLQRVDVTYTLVPPIQLPQIMQFTGAGLGVAQLHRQVSMRAVN